MRRRIEVKGPVDPATAWERYADLGRWAMWAPQIRSVEAGADRLAVGLRGTVHALGGLRVPFVVDDVDPGARAWRWTVNVAGIRVHMLHDLTPTRGGTTAGLTMDGPAPFALTYGVPARVALRRLCRVDL